MLTKPAVREYAYSPRQTRRRPHRISRYLKQAAIAILTFVLTASLLNQIIPSPLIPGNVDFISLKHQYYQAHRDKYNALFFGSSRIYSQIIPKVFDETVKAAGMEVNSFNFGIPALRALPGYVLLRDVLRDPPKNLQWVFIETPLDKGYEPIENARTNRAIYWHTAANTRLAIQYILASNDSLLDKASLIASHLLPFCYHQMNIGRLFSQWLPVHQHTPEEKAFSETFLPQDGYLALTDEADPKRQHFLAHFSQYEGDVEQLANQQTRIESQLAHIEPSKLALMQAIVQTIEAAGAKPIFVIPPTLEPQPEIQRAYRLGQIPALFAFNNPQTYTHLYALEQRHDAEHLNDQGAQALTQLVAQKFVEAQAP